MSHPRAFLSHPVASVHDCCYAGAASATGTTTDAAATAVDTAVVAVAAVVAATVIAFAAFPSGRRLRRSHLPHMTLYGGAIVAKFCLLL